MTTENEKIKRIWAAFQNGSLTPIELGQRILEAAVQIQGSVTPDLDRKRRCGYPEVIYGSGKSPDAIRTVAEALLADNDEVLVTRVTPEQVRPLTEMFTFTRWSNIGRTLRIAGHVTPIAPNDIERKNNQKQGTVAVVSAGTTDEPIAMESLETLAWMGVPTIMIQDIGVAGPYRLMSQVSKLQTMAAIVCVAGMEGALPSVLAGHVRCPVIAVPTSIGYGANFAGLAALLGMLNSCASNVAVVNIDAGFKAGYLAGIIANGVG